jgi:hypothetical protein
VTRLSWGGLPARKAPASAQPDPMHVIYMYVRAGSSTADPADSHVQTRTAPQTHRQKYLGAGFTGTGNDGAGIT